MNTFQKHFRWLAFCLICLAALGCGGEKGQPLGYVEGTVTLDGKPVQGANLEFIPDAPGGSTAFGTTDEQGHYEMYFGSKGTGAVVGKSLVRITSDDRVVVGGEAFERREVFPPKYNARSEQTVDVKDGNNTFDFACESGEFKPRAPTATSSGGT